MPDSPTSPSDNAHPPIGPDEFDSLIAQLAAMRPRPQPPTHDNWYVAPITQTNAYYHPSPPTPTPTNAPTTRTSMFYPGPPETQPTPVPAPAPTENDDRHEDDIIIGDDEIDDESEDEEFDDEWADDSFHDDDEDDELDDENTPIDEPPPDSIPVPPSDSIYLPEGISQLVLTNAHRALLRQWFLPEDTPLYTYRNTISTLIVHHLESFIVESQPFRVRVPALYVAMELKSPEARSPSFIAWVVDPSSKSELIDDAGNVFRMGRAAHPHMNGINGGGVGNICMGNLPVTICQLYEQADLPTIWAFLKLGLRNYNPESPYWRVEDAVPSHNCGKCRVVFRSLVEPVVHRLDSLRYTFCNSCEQSLKNSPSIHEFLGMVCSVCKGSCTDARYVVHDPRPGVPATKDRVCRRCYDEHTARRCKNPACAHLTDSDHHDNCFLHYPLVRHPKLDMYKSPIQYLCRYLDRIEVTSRIPTGAVRCLGCSIITGSAFRVVIDGMTLLFCPSCMVKCNWCDKPVDPTTYFRRAGFLNYACRSCNTNASQTKSFMERCSIKSAQFLNLFNYEAFTCTECGVLCRDGGSHLQFYGHLHGSNLCGTCSSKKIHCRCCTHLFPSPYPHHKGRIDDWVCRDCNESPDFKIQMVHGIFNPAIREGVRPVTSRCHLCHEHFLPGNGLREYQLFTGGGETTPVFTYICEYCRERSEPVFCLDCGVYLEPHQIRTVRGPADVACPYCFQTRVRNCTVCNQPTWSHRFRPRNPTICSDCPSPRRTPYSSSDSTLA